MDDTRWRIKTPKRSCAARHPDSGSQNRDSAHLLRFIRTVSMNTSAVVMPNPHHLTKDFGSFVVNTATRMVPATATIPIAT